MVNSHVIIAGGNKLNLVNFVGIWWMSFTDFKVYLEYNRGISINEFCRRRNLTHLLQDHSIKIPTDIVTASGNRMVECMYISVPLAISLGKHVSTPKKTGRHISKIRTNKARVLWKELEKLTIKGVQPSTIDVTGIPGVALKKEDKVLGEPTPITNKTEPKPSVSLAIAEASERKKKRRKGPSNSEVFLIHITSLINNLLIENVNYTNGFYERDRMADLLVDTKERAGYILREVERTKHLVEDVESKE